MKYVVYPYQMYSESARLLASALDVKRVYPDRNYTYEYNHIVINWGNSTLPEWNTSQVMWLNYPRYVNVAVNKIATFEELSQLDVRVPDHTTEYEQAVAMGRDNNLIVRESVTSHGGNDCIYVPRREEIPDGSLFSTYIPGDEYRVTVFNGRAIDYCKKLRTYEEDDPDWRIRSCDNGFVLGRKNVEWHEDVEKQAINAVKYLGLFFGTVDIRLHNREDRAYVLEVNTAPGLEPESTLFRHMVGAFRIHIASL